MGLPSSLAGLLQAAAWPHPVRGMELVETHISWVLLTGDYAYKIKRPVQYAFIDLRDPQRRAELCREEVRLNRRFAAPLYLEVCPVVRRDGAVHMGGDGEVLEHAVRMRQFSPAEQLDRLVAAGGIEPQVLRDFGAALADIHATLPRAGEPRHSAIADNLQQAIDLESGRLGTARIAALAPRLLQEHEELQSWMTARRATGHVRECHGDLHCANVTRWEGHLMAFDCLEFDAGLRCMDVAQEIAFLLADLRARGAARLANVFLNGYLARSGDFAACAGLALYQAHCALVRAKVMALSGTPAAGTPGFGDYVATAERLLDRSHRPALILVMGRSGTGKTYLASRLAPLVDAVHLRSDVERKRLAGLEERDRSGSGLESGLYAPENTAHLYGHLAETAELVFKAGLPVIVDATFGARARRLGMAELARRLGVPLRVLVCEAPARVLEERVQRRLAEGRDASEADARVLDWQLQHDEPIHASEELGELRVDTSMDLDATRLDALACHCTRGHHRRSPGDGG